MLLTPAFPHMCDSDVGEATLKIIGVSTEDDGIYTCIAVNDMGSASSSASLRVLGKPPGAELLPTVPTASAPAALGPAALGAPRSLERKEGACMDVQKRLRSGQCHKKRGPLKGLGVGGMLLC